MKRDSILPEKDVTSFLKDACLSGKDATSFFERYLSFRKRYYVFLRNLSTQLNIKITLHSTSPLSLLPSPFN